VPGGAKIELTAASSKLSSGPLLRLGRIASAGLVVVLAEHLVALRLDALGLIVVRHGKRVALAGPLPIDGARGLDRARGLDGARILGDALLRVLLGLLDGFPLQRFAILPGQGLHRNICRRRR
jgi:hypothetical protein